MQIFVILLVITVSLSVTAQPLQLKKTWGGYVVMEDDHYLKLGETVKLMKDVPEAHSVIKSARNYYVISQIMGAAGGALLGWSVADWIQTGKINLPLAGAGAAFVAVGLPVASSADKKLKKAVDLYNASKQKQTSGRSGFRMQIWAGPATAGLRIQF